jgi:hypothetical protein
LIRLTGKSTTIADTITFNSDSGANYSYRRSRNDTGGGTGAANGWLINGTAVSTDAFHTMEIINESAYSKYSTAVGTE